MLRQLAWILAFLLASVTIVACGTSETLSQPSVRCGPARSLPEGSSVQTIESGGSKRSYVLYVPRGYDGSARVPLVMLFHGLGGDPATIMQTTHMIDLADDKGAILVAPAGRGKITHWNFRASVADKGGDLHFVRDLLKEIKTNQCIDASQVYAAGFSNGSALTLALACDGTMDFAAYGAVSAPFYESRCDKAPPASIIYFHGMEDKVVPFGGAQTVIGPLPPVTEVMSEWSRHNRCPAGGSTTTVSEHVRHYAWVDCSDDSAVSVYAIDNGGHRWPGGDGATTGRVSGVMTQEIDASTLIWEFFDQHVRGGQ